MLGGSACRYSARARPSSRSRRKAGQVCSASPTNSASTRSRSSSGQRVAKGPPATTRFPRRRKASASSKMRRLWTTYPVNPTMSASVSKSTGSTFSSQRITSCPGGVSPATVGSERLGNTQRFPRLGSARSKVQKDSGFFGAIR